MAKKSVLKILSALAIVRNSGAITCDLRLEKIVGNKFSRKPRRGEAQGCVEYSEQFGSQFASPMNKSELP